MRGEIYLEGRAFPRLALDADETAVALHDPERGRKPEPGAFAHLLGGEKGIEDLVDDGRGNNRAGVPHLEEDVRSSPGLGVDGHAGVVGVKAGGRIVRAAKQPAKG